MINWIIIKEISQVEEILKKSESMPFVVFKHSPRCTISAMAKFHLEEEWNFADTDIQAYLLDVVKYSKIAQSIADVFSAPHQSPQLLVIHQGECILESAQLDIKIEEITEVLEDDMRFFL